MGEVVELNVVTSLDIPVDRVLRKAIDETLDTVVIIGWDKEGKLYFSSSISGGPEVALAKINA